LPCAASPRASHHYSNIPLSLFPLTRAPPRAIMFIEFYPPSFGFPGTSLSSTCFWHLGKIRPYFQCFLICLRTTESPHYLGTPPFCSALCQHKRTPSSSQAKAPPHELRLFHSLPIRSFHSRNARPPLPLHFRFFRRPRRRFHTLRFGQVFGCHSCLHHLLSRRHARRFLSRFRPWPSRHLALGIRRRGSLSCSARNAVSARRRVHGPLHLCPHGRFHQFLCGGHASPQRRTR